MTDADATGAALPTPPALPDGLRLQLFDATELGILRASLDEPQLPRVQFVAGELSVGLRTADGAFVSNEAADAWPVSFTEALRTAFDLLPALELAGTGFAELTDEEQVAALILSPSRAAGLQVQGDLAIVPLAQTRVVVTGTDEEAGFARALEVADELLAAGERLASIHPIGDRDGQWAAFPWRARFPALGDRISRVTREYGVRGYLEQASALDAGEVRVLEPKLDTLDSGVTVTFATWLSETDALLPVVDNVIVAGRSGALGVMGFAEFLDSAGTNAVATDLVPPRYFVSRSLALAPQAAS